CPPCPTVLPQTIQGPRITAQAPPPSLSLLSLTSSLSLSWPVSPSLAPPASRWLPMSNPQTYCTLLGCAEVVYGGDWRRSRCGRCLVGRDGDGGLLLWLQRGMRNRYRRHQWWGHDGSRRWGWHTGRPHSRAYAGGGGDMHAIRGSWGRRMHGKQLKSN
ncbi:hypothetical protein EV421DRAFT_1997799, partial [Armillaria borealis]